MKAVGWLAAADYRPDSSKEHGNRVAVDFGLPETGQALGQAGATMVVIGVIAIILVCIRIAELE